MGRLKLNSLIKNSKNRKNEFEMIIIFPIFYNELELSIFFFRIVKDSLKLLVILIIFYKSCVV